MNDGAFVILIIVVAVIGIASWVWQSGRAEQLLQNWAAENGYQLIDYERRWLRMGPYFFFTGKGQVVYRVTIQQSDGTTRGGWVRVGGMFLGLFSNNVDSQLDDE